MPARPHKGRQQYAWELPPELVEAVRAAALERGRSLQAEVARALERHLASPEAVADKADSD